MQEQTETTTVTPQKPSSDDDNKASEKTEPEKGGFISGLMPNSKPKLSWVWNKHASGRWVALAAEPILPFSFGVILSIYLFISGLVQGNDKSSAVSAIWIIIGLYILVSTVTGAYRGESIMEEGK